MKTATLKRRPVADEAESEWVSCEFVARKILGCHPNSVVRYVVDGLIPAPTKLRGLVRYNAQAVRAAMARGGVHK